jgi:hypothetical protein
MFASNSSYEFHRAPDIRGLFPDHVKQYELKNYHYIKNHRHRNQYTSAPGEAFH